MTTKRILALAFGLVLLSGGGWTQTVSYLGSSGGGPPIGGTVYPVSAIDNFRIKAWNSWPQTEQVVTTSPYCETAGPENAQAKVVIKFRRKNNPNVEVTSTRIITVDNDRGLGGVASAGVLSLPFGAAAGRGRSVSDANSIFNTKNINSISAALPAVVTTSVAHGITSGDLVYISGSNSTPSADGLWHAINASGSTFSIAMNVLVAGGAAGTVVTSRTVTSATAAFTVDDLGRNITLTGAQASLCTATGTWGTGQPWASLNTVVACQGPKFPFGLPYQGTIIGYTNPTTVTVKPSLTANPGGTGVLKIEPVLTADQDGLELGDGWITGVDINYWAAGGSSCALKRGQWFFEAEINRGPRWNMHEGVTLIKNYLEPSGHLSWPYGAIASGKVDGKGYSRNVLATTGAGQEFTIIVPSKAHWKVRSLRAIFVASATVATRTPQLIVDDGTNVIWTGVPVSEPTASQTHGLIYAPGVTHDSKTLASGAIMQYCPLPDLDLLAGQRVRSSTTSIQAGDQWSAIVLGVEEWIEE